MKTTVRLGLLALLGTSLILSLEAGWGKHDLHEYVENDEIGAIALAMGDAQDPNDPNNDGRLALVSAVKEQNYEIADYLSQYRANATISEPESGDSALVTAFEEGDVKMVHLLLMYGANPDVADGHGKTAREIASSNSELQALVDKYDKEGPVAFEDAPGTWSKHTSPKHNDHPFFHNNATGESRFLAPVSCSWIRVNVQDHDLFVNTMTQQTLWKRPNALAWRRVLDEATGNPYWYNYRTEKSVPFTPAEMPNDLLAEIKGETGTYWYNHVTGASSWEDPKESGWRRVKHSETGRDYWFHPSTHDSTWTAPEEHAWEEHHSEEHGRAFFHNPASGLSTWDKPASMGWVKGSLLEGLKTFSDEF